MEYIIFVQESNRNVIFASFGFLILIGAVFFLQSKNQNGSLTSLFPSQNNQIISGNNPSIEAKYNFAAGVAPKFSFPSIAYASDLKDKTTIYNAGGQQVQANLTINQQGTGSQVSLNQSQSFTPGKYTLVVDENGKKISQDFTWGVLAINPHKSIYLPGEIAALDLAVLDQKGNMVCDAKVNLTITQPSGISSTATTDNGDIKVNPECHQKKATQNPDYETNYKLMGGAGQYKMQLTAQTRNGTFSITDFLYVANSVDFDVERQTATRIFPYSTYPMQISIKANKDFIGQIQEVAPSSFEITTLDGVTGYTKINTSDKTKTIVWDVNLKKGQNITIGYTFKAPNISPQFFLLGPLKLSHENTVVFSETRQWQLAIDGIYSSIILNDSPVGYWRLGESSGTTAVNATGNTANDGTYNNSPTLGVTGAIVGDPDTAASFTPASAFVQVTGNASLDLLDGPLSLEAWVKLANTVGATTIIIGKDPNAYALGYYGDTGVAPHQFFMSKSSVARIVVTNTAVTDTTTWHHIVATKNGATSHIYLDGQDDTNLVGNQTLANSGGALRFSGASPSTFQGSIDEIAIYNTVLTPAQVQEHYLAGVGSCVTYRSDNFNRGDQSNFGTSSGGDIWTTYPLTSITSNKGRSALTTGTETSPRLGGAIPADFDAKIMFRFSAHNPDWDAEIRGRFNEIDDWVRGGIGADGHVFIQQKTGGVASILGSAALTLVDATDYYIRFRAVGDTIMVKAWKTTDPEPGWMAIGTTTVTGSGTIGITAFASTTVNFDWDDFTVNDNNPACGDFLFNGLRLNGLRIN